MVPVIELWEKRIAAAGKKMYPDVTDAEMQVFLAGVSNPENVQQFLDNWNDPDADLEEELDGDIEDDWDIEVVVDDTDEPMEENDFLGDFVAEFLGVGRVGR